MRPHSELLAASVGLALASGFDGVVSSHGEQVRRNAKIPHKKRHLRLAALRELEEYGITDCTEHNFILAGRVLAKFKKDEFAKPGKYGRLTVDMSTTASLLGYLIKPYLVAFGQDFRCAHGYCSSLVKADRSSLRVCFQRALVENAFYFKGDDNFFRVLTSEGPLYGNGDLATCDISQGASVMMFLIHITPPQYKCVMKALVDQLSSPMEYGTRGSKLRFSPVDYVEYSGSVLTTLLNNVASLCIGVQIMAIDYSNMTIADAKIAIRNCLDHSGWNVTVDFVDNFEQLTFLKHNPVYTEVGEVDAIANLGMLLRAIGQCVGDYPGRGSFELRAYLFNCALVASMQHCGDHALHDALRQRFPDVVEINHSALDKFRSISGTDIGRVPLHSLCKRYNIDVAEILHLIDLMLQGEWSIDCAATRAIMGRDYNL